MAGARTTGLPWHLAYPFIMLVLIAVATWSSASSMHLAAANSLTTQIRFGPRDYCGYNVSVVDGVRYYDPLGCIDGGWNYQVDRLAVGVSLPGALSTSLSKGAALLLVSFVLLILALFFQAYGTRYSFRKDPEPTKERLYTLISLHVFVANATTLTVWIAFIVIAAICAAASSYKGVNKTQALESGGIRVWWGTSPWLVLGAGLVGLPWAYESVRWRHAELSKKS